LDGKLREISERDLKIEELEKQLKTNEKILKRQVD